MLARFGRPRRVVADGDERVLHLRRRAARTRAAIRFAMSSVDSRLVPSGARSADLELRLVVLGDERLVGHHEQRHGRQQHGQPAADDRRRGGPATSAAAPCRRRPAGRRAASASSRGRRRRPRAAGSHRADIIGVSVKLTSIDTRMANAIVMPKLFMNRPTMPPMKATGTKMATSDSVVASTARPISRVASMAASNGGRAPSPR